MAVPPPLPPVDKPALRRALRQRRRAFVDALAPAAVDAAQAALATRVLHDVGDARVVALYVAVGAEIDPLTLLERLAAAGVTTALPAASAHGAPLRFLRWAPGDALVMGALDIPEPMGAAVTPDLIVAPLIGFDRALRRLGQGGGFYDRTFAAHPAARRIGLAWSVQEVESIPADAWDMPLDAVATEQEWIR